MLENRLESILNSFQGVCGIAVKNLKTDDQFLRNGTTLFPAASLIKLFILWEFFRRHDEGQLELNTEITLCDRDKVGGFGILKEMHEGLKLTYLDLAVLMIILSDNVATNLLIDMLGMAEINAVIEQQGFQQTCLQRKMMDAEAKKRGLDNFTSPADILRLLTELETGTALSMKSRKQFIDILTRQQCNNKLPTLLPPGTIIAHKTGDLPQVEHDVGIIYINEEPVITIVMTKDLASNAEGVLLNNAIGSNVYNYFANRRS